MDAQHQSRSRDRYLIPNSFLQAWSHQAPWPDPRQIEQDLIISRALCDLFNHSALKGKIAFRGGTAINKLLFKRPLRYSEDIDLVQTTAEPIGTAVDAIRDALSWLGKCSRDQAGHSMHLVFRFAPEADPGAPLKLKVEINTREHSNLYGLKDYAFSVGSDWYHAEAQITSFQPDEIFGTKLRALLQRNKNRDLFDLSVGMRELSLSPAKIVAVFEHYLALEGVQITRAIAEQRMLAKLARSLTEDIAPLLPVGVRYDDAEALDAFESVWLNLITLIKGESWKLTRKTIEDLRSQGILGLLKKVGG